MNTDNTIPDTTDNGQPALTAGELAALWNNLSESEKSHLQSFVREPHSVTFNGTGDLLVKKGLVKKGLVKWGWSSGHVVTDLGKQVLAAQAASEPKPTTITARQFLADGYAVKVELGDCGVFWRDLIIKSCDEKGEMFNCVTVDRLMPTIHFFNPTDQFAVEWARGRWADGPLPSAPVPATADGESLPTVVCLCGSTRFSEAFQQANFTETLAGRIVLTIGCDMKSDNELFKNMSEDELTAVKVKLDKLHFQKIELADEVLILNVGGYIGESTKRELAYAKSLNKGIRYLEALAATGQPAIGDSGQGAG